VRIEIMARDQIISRYGNALLAIGDKAPIAMRDALNREGDNGRTQIKRALVKATGIKYGLINRGFSTNRANRNTLTYAMTQKGEETNLNLFGATQRKKGVSARPWNVRRIFPGTFLVGRYGNKVFNRKGAGRFPLKQVYGPNLAREIVKDEPKRHFEAIPLGLAETVGKQIARYLPG
jgi:hypothetical protein